MDTKKTASQLRLAADILETGHPFMASPKPDGLWCVPKPAEMDVLKWPVDKYEIRLALAIPPDGRPLHNPRNLTAEQVGAGYRLLLEEETTNQPHERWIIEAKRWHCAFEGHQKAKAYPGTYRVPLSVPWPEPPKLEPTFQLPPPPPGMQWHREDGWTAEDLPQGYRPLTKGERIVYGDEGLSEKNFSKFDFLVGRLPTAKARTTRPLTFTHKNQTWTYHRPGDPMPCDGKSNIYCVGGRLVSEHPRPAAQWFWNEKGEQEIIGWRYADEPKPQVPLGPEDVPPGSILKANSWDSHEWRSVDHVYSDGALLSNCPRTHRWGELMRDYQINRSLPITGKWNPDAWEPCHKPA